EILANLARGLPAEARHARWDVGLEADPLLLTVVADVDPRRQLRLDHALDGAVHLRGHGGGSNGFARLAADQELGQPRAAWQAAHVRRQDFIAAVDHGCSPRNLTVRLRLVDRMLEAHQPPSDPPPPRNAPRAQ